MVNVVHHFPEDSIGAMVYKKRDGGHIEEQATAKERTVAENGFEQRVSRRIIGERQREGGEFGIVALAGLVAPALEAETGTFDVAGPRQQSRIDREG
jgi:hypothetical protein